MLMPKLLYIIGKVIGVTFDTFELKVKTEDNNIISGFATSEIIEQALKMRTETIQALLMKHEANHFLWVKDMNDKICELSEEERTKYLLNKWNGVLEKLAQ